MSTLGEHQGNGIRFDMHLSAPNGGIAQMLCRPEGQWVSWNEYEKLKAEVERIRKAGDAMADAFVDCLVSQRLFPSESPSLKRWIDAKKGNPNE